MGEFDQSNYWIDRHRDLVGDPRSVGNLGATVEQNQAGERELIDLIANIAETFPKGRVLDLGCGYGRVAGPFLQNGWDYTGYDVSPDAISQAKASHPAGDFQERNLLRWKPDQSFDLVIALYVLVHFVDDADWDTFARNALSAIEPGGAFLLADHFPAERSSMAHYVSRPLEEYEPLMAEAGFALDETTTAEIHRGPGGAHRQQFRVFRRLAKSSDA